ncbi:S9 family peptidase [Pseudogemmatithrix spongiicola]|uniref:S9 family peptidase n=1 Tax=Pseudogemmatithrix spongiicola TaxID=3062599 RepID=A0AA49JVR8_9BACT|nr:S9 family peptidase [Gemmatimonadaceae bacterium 'strain 138']WKW15808.1 S9 family peptidase [Gemmatimonadaceae bacterium 'strain 318']
MEFRPIAAAAALAVLSAAPLTAQSARAIVPADLLRLRAVGEPRVSPDGEWVVFTVSRVDSTKDKRDSDIYMVRWDGTRRLRLTSSSESESDPRWSPDGRYLSFVSSRQGSDASQLWLLERAGGEAQRVTELDEGVDDYAWSPDGSRIVIVSKDVDSLAKADTTRPRPIVIDRYLAKRDGDGWLDRRRTHLYLFEVASKTLAQLTRGDADDREPAWSPDGRRIVFTSARHTDEDRSDESDLYVVDARAGAEPQRLTSSPAYERSATFSPDGQWIAFIQGTFTPVPMYGTPRIAVMPAAGGTPRVLAPALDRPQSDPVWTADGAAVLTILDDDRRAPLVRIAVADGAITRLIDGRRAVDAVHQAHDRIALRVSDVATPAELFALDGDSLRRLTRENDAWRAEVRTAEAEEFAARSRDGTMVHGILTRALGADASRPQRTVLWIHGGPVAQNDWSFWLEKEALAAAGWNVLQMNYRGSSGRGEAFQRAIYADWCGKEVEDLMAAVDEAVRRGIADSARLGVGGWSYGGILTDCLIATTTRFKAAISGAGSSLFTSMYGSDQYPSQYDAELGPPWKNPRLWEKVSYAFWRAERIKTPTLFMGGADDFNVPIAGSEQMYLALRTQNVPTQLVVYPGENHGIRRPSFAVDRVTRWIDWLEKHTPAARPRP